NICFTHTRITKNINKRMDELCRCCAKNCSTLENIFAERELKNDEPPLIAMLDAFTSCEIRQYDPLPQAICGPCIASVQSAFRFKVRCEQNQKYLTELLKENDVKPFIDEVIAEDYCVTASNLGEVHPRSEHHCKDEDALGGVDDPCLTEKYLVTIDDEAKDEEEKYFEDNEVVSDEYVEESEEHSLTDDSESAEYESETELKSKRTRIRKSTGDKSKVENVKEMDESNSKDNEEDNEGPFPCPHCSKQMKTKTTLKIHLRLHSNEEKPFACHLCSNRYWKKTDLKNHILRHTGEKPHKCPRCSQRFLRRETLNRHIRNNPPSCTTAPAPYNCAQCSKGFGLRNGLKSHIRNNICGLWTTAQPSARDLKCPRCSKEFFHLSSLKGHIRSNNCGRVSKLFQCPHCPKRVRSTGHLEDHIRLHTGERFKCSDCPASFISKQGFLMHQRSHTGEKPLKCTECSECFMQYWQLTAHLRREHKILSKLKRCTICAKNFKTEEALEKHLMTHKEEFPFKCEQCWKFCKTSFGLRKHTLTH
ncbi:hypothetical protein KR093_003183, partial [Drosophila rubida]